MYRQNAKSAQYLQKKRFVTCCCMATPNTGFCLPPVVLNGEAAVGSCVLIHANKKKKTCGKTDDRSALKEIPTHRLWALIT